MVLGDRDLAAPLRRVGVPVTVVSPRTAAVRYSRYASGWLPDPRPDEQALCELLLDHARHLSEAVLFYEQDDDLLFVSRRRHELSAGLRFVIPDADVVEQLLDKAAFQQLAGRLGLPVPPGRLVDLRDGLPDVSDLGWPLVVKPVRREASWFGVSQAKALIAHGPGELERMVEELLPEHSSVLVQQPVAGPETSIESYHVYVDASGEPAAEFTGRKIRTHPEEMGHSTALVTTDAPDVAALGREVVGHVGLRGVAKLDFKRDPTGRLWLLEINPRFNLWHHVGAAAGVNIPAFVWADLVGERRPDVVTARPGVRWCRVEKDVRAAREQGVGLLPWLRWAWSCETRAGLDPRDPLPVLTTALAKAASAVLGRRRR